MEINKHDLVDILIQNWQMAPDLALFAGNKIDDDMEFDLILDSIQSSWNTSITTLGNDVTSNMKIYL
jgi:hypothetical protein